MSPVESTANWLELYRLALLETHPDALLGRTHLARAAMRARLHERPAAEEAGRLEDGLRNLNVLEREFYDLAQSGKLRATNYVTLSSRDHKWIEVSDGIRQLLGYERAEILGHPAREFVAPELRETTKSIFEELIRNGRVSGRHELVRKDGQRVVIDFQSYTFPDGAIISYWYPHANQFERGRTGSDDGGSARQRLAGD